MKSRFLVGPLLEDLLEGDAGLFELPCFEVALRLIQDRVNFDRRLPSENHKNTKAQNGIGETPESLLVCVFVFLWSPHSNLPS